MKRIIALVLAFAACFALFCSCANDPGDFDYIQKKGTMVIGYTLYPPMNYKDEGGELIGFDTEFAKLVCAELGVEPVFQLINWETKETELNAKNLDAIWNGFTVDEDRKQHFAFSTSYITNKQIVVIKKSNADKYKDLASLAGASCAAEKDSAGEKAIKSTPTIKSNTYVGSEKQTDVLMEVKSGTCEFGVVDYIMVKTMFTEGGDYSDLMYVESIELPPEEYAIGFRLGCTETVAKVNAAIEKLAKDGKLSELAAKYELTEQLSDALKN